MKRVKGNLTTIFKLFKIMKKFEEEKKIKKKLMNNSNFNDNSDLSLLNGKEILEKKVLFPREKNDNNDNNLIEENFENFNYTKTEIKKYFNEDKILKKIQMENQENNRYNEINDYDKDENDYNENNSNENDFDNNDNTINDMTKRNLLKCSRKNDSEKYLLQPNSSEKNSNYNNSNTISHIIKDNSKNDKSKKKSNLSLIKTNSQLIDKKHSDKKNSLIQSRNKLEKDNLILQEFNPINESNINFNFKNLNRKENSLNASSNSFTNLLIAKNPKNNLTIESPIQIYYLLGKYSEKKYHTVIEIKKRTYNFYFKKNENQEISCFKVSITKPKSFFEHTDSGKSWVKIFIILGIYLILWYFISIFVQNIYENYGENIFEICVLPLISMLFIKLLFTVNIKLLICTCVLYFSGDYFIRTKKFGILRKILLHLFVPIMAFKYYDALSFYKMFEQNY